MVEQRVSQVLRVLEQFEVETHRVFESVEQEDFDTMEQKVAAFLVRLEHIRQLVLEFGQQCTKYKQTCATFLEKLDTIASTLGKSL